MRSAERDQKASNYSIEDLWASPQGQLGGERLYSYIKEALKEFKLPPSRL